MTCDGPVITRTVPSGRRCSPTPDWAVGLGGTPHGGQGQRSATAPLARAGVGPDPPHLPKSVGCARAAHPGTDPVPSRAASSLRAGQHRLPACLSPSATAEGTWPQAALDSTLSNCEEPLGVWDPVRLGPYSLRLTGGKPRHGNGGQRTCPSFPDSERRAIRKVLLHVSPSRPEAGRHRVDPLLLSSTSAGGEFYSQEPGGIHRLPSGLTWPLWQPRLVPRRSLKHPGRLGASLGQASSAHGEQKPSPSYR